MSMSDRTFNSKNGNSLALGISQLHSPLFNTIPVLLRMIGAVNMPGIHHRRQKKNLHSKHVALVRKHNDIDLP
jgi:hypothetical protein